MKQNFIILYFIILSFNKSFTQILNLELPFYANKEVILLECNGLRKDTIFKTQLNDKGYTRIGTKKIKKNTGIVELKIKNINLLSYEFILSPTENTTLQCSDEYVYPENVKHRNSPENINLNRWFEIIARQKNKILSIEQLQKLYTQKTTFVSTLENEKKELETHIKQTKDTIQKSQLFAAAYIKYRIAEAEILNKPENTELIKAFFETQINFDILYHSNHWFQIINPCLEAYNEKSAYHKQFGKDLITNLKKCKSDEVYEALAEAGLLITESMNWQQDQETILYFLVQDNRIKAPTGRLKSFMKMGSLLAGNKAPNILLPEAKQTKIVKAENLSKKYSLLFFYESGCGHCLKVIDYLKENKDKIKQKGITIYSFASDMDLTTFQNTASNFPWTNKYCDLKGFKGENFSNYAIVGTPTLFLLDEKGIILKKLATAEEIFDVVK